MFNVFFVDLFSITFFCFSDYMHFKTYQSYLQINTEPQKLTSISISKIDYNYKYMNLGAAFIITHDFDFDISKISLILKNK